METSHRAVVLDDLASLIAGVRMDRPVRVAIDGRTASGKTTLADELAKALGKTGRQIIRTSIDAFHRPRVERYARGRHSAEGYYYDARDLPAINALLLSPLGPGGDLRYRTASHDLESDRLVEQEPQTASSDAILIVDGTFLQRLELRDGWDLAIFVESTEQVSEQRGVDRDAGRLGGADATRQLYAVRYKPAFDLYESLCAPASIADAVFGNDDFAHPVLKVREGGGLALHGAGASGWPQLAE